MATELHNRTTGVRLRFEREQVPSNLRAIRRLQEDQEADEARLQQETAGHRLR